MQGSGHQLSDHSRHPAHPGLRQPPPSGEAEQAAAAAGHHRQDREHEGGRQGHPAVRNRALHSHVQGAPRVRRARLPLLHPQPRGGHQDHPEEHWPLEKLLRQVHALEDLSQREAPAGRDPTHQLGLQAQELPRPYSRVGRLSERPLGRQQLACVRRPLWLPHLQAVAEPAEQEGTACNVGRAAVARGRVHGLPAVPPGELSRQANALE
mmetsp:Transcript_4711/g.16575  ORF Transcript_4711/g.16575 Transcript_4711/m.16575 type:complete len:209 (+) Transcript_4711:695-1321(+)